MSHIGKAFGVPMHSPNVSAAASDPYEMSTTDLVAASVTLSFAAIGLIADVLACIAVFSIKQLQKTSNAFLIHHMVLDMVKCIYIFIFDKSLFEQRPVLNCGFVGSSYVVLITVTAFNLLAITLNYIYHFTNKVVNIKTANFCCIMFGVSLIWIASCIVNLGVAFVSTKPVFHNEIGFCTFTYGLNGSYILHALWIFIITIVLITNAFYLRRLHQDITKRSYQKIVQLIHSKKSTYADPSTASTSQGTPKPPYVSVPMFEKPIISLAATEETNPLAESTMDRIEVSSASPQIHYQQSAIPEGFLYLVDRSTKLEYVQALSQGSGSISLKEGTITSEEELIISLDDSPHASSSESGEMRTSQKLLKTHKAVITGERNFYILVAMMILFVIFWYPLFLVTALDIGFTVEIAIYKNLIRMGWLHCITTPFLFIFYNLPYLRKQDDGFETPSESSSISELTNLEDSQTSHKKSFSRPVSLDLPLTPMTYNASELSYQIVYNLLDEDISPSIISHIVDLQHIKQKKKRKLAPSKTCPDKLAPLSTINEIRGLESNVDLSEIYQRRRNKASANPVKTLHRLSTGCVCTHLPDELTLNKEIPASILQKSAISWL